MRRLKILAAALAFTAAAPVAAAAQTTPLTLAAGEEATVTIDDGGVPVVVRRGAAAALSPFDRAALEDLTSGEHDDAVGPNSVGLNEEHLGTTAPPVTRGHLRIVFAPVSGGKGSLLVIENGYDRGFAYRAQIFSNGRLAPTDVCVVLPERRSYEHWGWPIDRIELTAFRLERYDGGPPRCE